MIDSHCHLYFEVFDPDRDQVIDRCENELALMINIGVDRETSQQAVELTEQSDKFRASIGWHPEEGSALITEGHALKGELEYFTTLIDRHPEKIVAIGEIGLDYHLPEINNKTINTQQQIFRDQIEFALVVNRPVIIHCRDAFDDTLRILGEYRHEKIRGVWHSFTGNPDQAEKIIEIGLNIGINGIVTFPSAKELQQSIQHIPLTKILLETDAPFLAPQPMRGKRNEPWMVKFVAEKIAELKNINVKEIEEQTDLNVRDLFLNKK